MVQRGHLIVQAGEELGTIPQLMERLTGRQTRFTHCDWLDELPTMAELESDASSRRERYRAFVSDGELSHQDHPIRAAIDRNKRTGGNHFVDEVERRIGPRIESRTPGRPRTQKKICPGFYENGEWVCGFICEPVGLEGAKEITQFGGWRGYLSSENFNALEGIS